MLILASGALFDVKITSSINNLDVSTLFTLAQWQSQLPKKVTINLGVIVGSTSSSNPSMTTGTGMGGTLELIIVGQLDGAGGPANGGQGGTALWNRIGSQLKVSGTGSWRGGGGGGGKAGNGGGGVFYTSRTVTEGPVYDGVNYVYYIATFSDGTNGGPPNGPVWGGGLPGGWSYFTGSFVTHQTYSSQGGNPHTYGAADLYTIYRQQTVTDVPNYTSGGTGGDGARGQGSDGSAGSGSSGTGGGTNAGSGAIGGNGGAFGSGGTNGGTGNPGNNGGGSSGQIGGTSGYAILGVTGMINNFTGTMLGLQG